MLIDNAYEPSWEDRILNRQDSEADECAECAYKQNCKNQCMEIGEVYNPYFPTA